MFKKLSSALHHGHADDAHAHQSTTSETDTSTTVAALVNAFRATHGLNALVQSSQLIDACTTHAAAMAAAAKMLVTPPYDPATLASAAGFKYTKIAATVGMGARTAADAVGLWTGSAQNAKQLLSPTATVVGAAVAVSAAGSHYWSLLVATAAAATAPHAANGGPAVAPAAEPGSNQDSGVASAELAAMMRSSPSTVSVATNPGGAPVGVSADLMDAVNAVRAHHGIAPALVMSETLETACLKHALGMAIRDSMTHDGRHGSSPGDRATGVGYKWRDRWPT
ncbi:hypothetical protein BC828DRAFT_407106 [Blastocladiella britannica]|nr:hypothetical protein BC828DRAFT_407106 [Blastocladiella britannica]